MQDTVRMAMSKLTACCHIEQAMEQHTTSRNLPQPLSKRQCCAHMLQSSLEAAIVTLKTLQDL